MDEGGHLAFCDETIFKSRDFNRYAYAGVKQKIVVEDRTPSQPCQAVCAAVCRCHGVIQFYQTDGSMNEDKFMDFLE